MPGLDGHCCQREPVEEENEEKASLFVILAMLPGTNTVEFGPFQTPHQQTPLH